MRKSQQHYQQRGAVSLFVVVFTALVVTIITVSFIQLMTADQRQATNADLSQSAYDSAQAGVEDAKRLMLLEQACKNGEASGLTCSKLTDALQVAPGDSATACDTLAKAGLVSETDGETLLQSDEGDAVDQLDQAYTCVKVAVNTPDYLGNLQAGESILVPLKGASSFNKVVLNWFSAEDVDSATVSPAVQPKLPVQSAWPVNQPPLMRAQLVQVGQKFNLDDFNGSNARTLFLFPATNGATTKDFNLDARLAPIKSPQPVKCLPGHINGYSCSVTLSLNEPANPAYKYRYLYLVPLYNKTHFQVELYNDNQLVSFKNVQPEVDSTGRANDVFRRIVSRIELRDNFTYPKAELDVNNGSICKTFTITDDVADYSNAPGCTP